MRLNLPKPRKLIKDASPLKRLMAFIIDLFVINLVIVYPFRSALTGFFGTSLSFQLPERLPFEIWLAITAIILLSWAYFSLTQYLLNQTPGMMLVNIEIAGQVSLAKGFFRNIYVFPVFPFYLLWILEPIVILIKKQGILDRISKTKVIETVEMV